MRLISKIPLPKTSKIRYHALLGPDGNPTAIYTGYSGDTYGPEGVGYGPIAPDRSHYEERKKWAGTVQLDYRPLVIIRLEHVRGWNTRSGSRQEFRDHDNREYTYDLNNDQVAALFQALAAGKARYEDGIFTVIATFTKKGENWNLEIATDDVPPCFSMAERAYEAHQDQT